MDLHFQFFSVVSLDWTRKVNGDSACSGTGSGSGKILTSTGCTLKDSGRTIQSTTTRVNQNKQDFNLSQCMGQN